jgi:hypothetical protein
MLTPSDADILSIVKKLPYPTLTQLLRFFGYSHNSRKYLGSRLKKMVAAKLLHTESLPRDTAFGNLPLVYTLGTEGIAYFRQKGLNVQYLSPKERKLGKSSYDHPREINDVLVAARQLQHLVPEIELTEFLHDGVLQRHPVKVTLPDAKGTGGKVIPDGFLKFHLSPPFADPDHPVLAAVFELDRDTEDVYDFKTKISKYFPFADGPYQQEFGTESLHILWIATRGGSRRLHQMRRWTLEELTKKEKLEYADLFRFVSVPLANACIVPRGFFLSPCWFTLQDDTPVPLIDAL